MQFVIENAAFELRELRNLVEALTKPVCNTVQGTHPCIHIFGQ